jgi:hypothetical protein
MIPQPGAAPSSERTVRSARACARKAEKPPARRAGIGGTGIPAPRHRYEGEYCPDRIREVAPSR